MIDPEKQKLVSLCMATRDRPLKEMAEILDAMLHRIIELERRLRPRDPHPNEAIGYPGLPLHTIPIKSNQQQT